MDISQAATELGNMLDASEERYPTSTRLAHLNQAIQELGRQYETRLNEGIGQLQVTSTTTNFQLELLSDMHDGSVYGEVVESMWYTEDYETNNVAQATGWTPNEEMKVVSLYPDYDTFMNSTGGYSGENTEFSAVQRGLAVHMVGQPDDALVRVVFRGPSISVPIGGNTPWLTLAPWPVIYHAAITACVWLEDEERIPVYERLLQRSAEIVNIADSMRGDVPLVSTEV